MMGPTAVAALVPLSLPLLLLLLLLFLFLFLVLVLVMQLLPQTMIGVVRRRTRPRDVETQHSMYIKRLKRNSPKVTTKTSAPGCRCDSDEDEEEDTNTSTTRN